MAFVRVGGQDQHRVVVVDDIAHPDHEAREIRMAEDMPTGVGDDERDGPRPLTTERLRRTVDDVAELLGGRLDLAPRLRADPWMS